jgi:hypothetical protein
MRDRDFPGPKLVVRHTGQWFSLAEGPVTIGREDDNHIVLADSRASRHHATIEDRAGTLVVQDLHSANGTFVNGRRVAGTQVLRQGDAIGIGETILDVVLAPGRDPAATIQANRAALPGDYAARGGGDQTLEVAGDWQASRRGSPWHAVRTGLLVVAIVAVAAALAFLLLRGDGAAPVIVVLESPASGSQVTTGDQVPLEASASGKEIMSLELLVDGVLAATASSPEAGGTDSLRVSTPWVFQAGTHIISARARTAGGEVSEPVAASLLAVDAVSQSSPPAPPAATDEPGSGGTTPEAPVTEGPPSPEPDTAAATSGPSLTPLPPTATPSLTPLPATSTPEDGSGSPPVEPGLITGFEEFGTWRRGAQANGTFTQSSDQVHGGAQAGKLAYSFPSGDNDFVVFLQTHPLDGRPSQISAWVYGDAGGHYLNVWIQDTAGETWQFSLGRVRHIGWQQMAARLQPGDPWPASHIDGPSNGAIDYPISFRGVVLDDAPDSFSGSGTIYLDDLGYDEASTLPATPTDTPAPNTTPAPVIQFWADDTTISAGEVTFLRWHVEHVTAVYLEGEPVTGPDGSRRVQPSVTTTYRLRVIYPGGEEVFRVTIVVN